MTPPAMLDICRGVNLGRADRHARDARAVEGRLVDDGDARVDREVLPVSTAVARAASVGAVQVMFTAAWAVMLVPAVTVKAGEVPWQGSPLLSLPERATV